MQNYDIFSYLQIFRKKKLLLLINAPLHVISRVDMARKTINKRYK